MNITTIVINILLKHMEAIGDISCDPLSNSLFLYIFYDYIIRQKNRQNTGIFSISHQCYQNADLLFVILKKDKEKHN